MKFLISCTFIVIAVAVIGAMGNVFIETRNPGGTRVAFHRNTPPVCTKAGPQCTKDCTKLLLCSSFSPNPLTTTICKAPNQYCVNGACTSNPGSECQTGGGSEGSNFECTDAGIFPDPLDCTQYHICEKSTSLLYHCSTGFVYNSQLKICQIGKTPCAKINCSKEKDVNTFMPYASNPAYYAFCTKDTAGAYQILMFKCSNEDFEVFDVKTSECKFKCKAKGTYQNPAKCREYYYCSGVNAQPILEKCPEQWVFDGTGCNKDSLKCQYKPTDKDELSEEEDADTNVADLVDGLKSDIINKICEHEKTNPCPQPQDVILEAKKFRTETVVDATIYFVSVMMDGVQVFHVRIKKPSQGDDKVESIKEPDNKDDKIERFDAN